MYVHGSVSVRGRRVGWHGVCETVGRFRPRMPILGACGAVGPEIQAEVLRQLVFEMGLLFGRGAEGRVPAGVPTAVPGRRRRGLRC